MVHGRRVTTVPTIPREEATFSCGLVCCWSPCDLVTEILMAQPDKEVIGERSEFDAQLLASIEHVHAALIVGTSPLEPEVACRLIRERLDTRLLAVMDDDQDACLCVPPGQLSPARLLDAVRRDS